MSVDQVERSGIIECEEALQRILDGKPVVSSHVGLDFSKLTASIISHEAGFDRGYLKKSRKSHLPIIAKIESIRAQAGKSTNPSSATKILRLEEKVSLMGEQLGLALAQRDRVLGQNIQLWERIRELEEAELKNKSLQVRLRH